MTLKEYETVKAAVTGKICPNPYVYNTTGLAWEGFKRLVSDGNATDKTQHLYRVLKSWEDEKSQLVGLLLFRQCKKS